MDIKLSDITQRRAEMLGEVGQAWVKALPDKVRQALFDYGLTFVDSLPGGSASYLAIVKERHPILLDAMYLWVCARVSGPKQQVHAQVGVC